MSAPPRFAVLGTSVMGTGIVSIALKLDHLPGPADVLMWATAAVWIAMAASLVAAASGDRRELADGSRNPVSLSLVAGTCVLGTRLTLQGWRVPAICLLGIAALAWLGLVSRVAGGWSRPVPGAGFLVTVAAGALSVLAAETASAFGADWLAVAGLVLLVLALLAYPVVLASFELRQLLTGRGDQWVSGGALAIAALAAGELVAAAHGLDALRPLHGALRDGAFAIWGAAIAWLPVLVGAELARARIAYDPRRWATVFPLGMYSAASIVVGRACGAPRIARFGEVWLWLAVVAWAAVAAASLTSGRGGSPREPAAG